MNILRSGLVVLFFLHFYAGISDAGTFADKFKNFVLGPDAEASYFSQKGGFGESGLDKVSRKCLNCHDGTKATNIAVKNADAPYQISGYRTENHPVGMSYNYYANRKPGEYKPRQFLNRDIRLVDGKVTCISCHKLIQDLPQGIRITRLSRDRRKGCTASGELAMAKNLCMECHNK